MQVPDALVDLQLSVYQERSALGEFVRSSGPGKDWSTGVLEEAARRQRSLEESERVLECGVRDQARTEDQVRELRRVLRRQALISLATQDARQPRGRARA
ncbi:hypothetical protein GCM10010515_72180 [Streptomyces fructofermentans]|uniref:Uncharacterized protein n=1 Tax=Streptomyces fructofermentans TaxID=152141 RepID=A0A918U4Y4_9ACTN|nr:hypothetical protein GCM10010515_72180 [Streptomyces fructofermentans]